MGNININNPSAYTDNVQNPTTGATVLGDMQTVFNEVNSKETRITNLESATMNISGIKTFLNGINLAETGDPSSLADGLMWYNSTSQILKFQANGQVIPIAYGSATIGRNLVVGGDFNTNPWQRGTSFTAPASGVYTADRFLTSYSGGMVFNIAQSADGPTVGAGVRYTPQCYQLSVTTADTSITAAKYGAIVYRIEGFDYCAIAQRQFTISFWVKSPKAGIHCLAVTNSGADRSYIVEYTIANAGVWQYVTATIPASPSAGTWNYTNGIGLEIRWTLACGSTYQTTSGSWNTGNFYGDSNQVNCFDSNSNVFKLANIQVEAGPAATQFESLPLSTLWPRFLRYYQKTFPQGTAPASNAGAAGAISSNSETASSGGLSALWQFMSPMRSSTPTITTYKPDGAGSNWSTNTTTPTASVASSSDKVVNIIATANITADTGYNIHATAEAEL